jgi:hypothetical protein
MTMKKLINFTSNHPDLMRIPFKIAPHLWCYSFPIITSLAYFYPVLSGKKIISRMILFTYKGNVMPTIKNRKPLVRKSTGQIPFSVECPHIT